MRGESDMVGLGTATRASNKSCPWIDKWGLVGPTANLLFIELPKIYRLYKTSNLKVALRAESRLLNYEARFEITNGFHS